MEKGGIRIFLVAYACLEPQLGEEECVLSLLVPFLEELLHVFPRLFACSGVINARRGDGSLQRFNHVHRVTGWHDMVVVDHLYKDKLFLATYLCVCVSLHVLASVFLLVRYGFWRQNSHLL